MPKVLIADDLSPAAVRIFHDRGIEADVRVGMKPDELLAVIGDYDGLAVRSATKVTAAVLQAGGAVYDLIHSLDQPTETIGMLTKQMKDLQVQRDVLASTSVPILDRLFGDQEQIAALDARISAIKDTIAKLSATGTGSGPPPTIFNAAGPFNPNTTANLLKEKADAYRDSLKGVGEVAETLPIKLDEVAVAVEDLNRPMEEFRSLTASALNTFTNDLEHNKSLAESFRDAWVNVLESLISKFNEMAAAAFATQLFGPTGAVGGGLGGLLGGIGKFLGFATGGQFVVGGSGGPDSQFVPLALTPGEVVSIDRGDRRRGGRDAPVEIRLAVETQESELWKTQVRALSADTAVKVYSQGEKQRNRQRELNG